MKKPIRKELLDELLGEYSNPEDLTGPEGLLKRLTGALVERALQAEMTVSDARSPFFRSA
jgi:putative transposase